MAQVRRAVLGAATAGEVTVLGAVRLGETVHIALGATRIPAEAFDTPGSNVIERGAVAGTPVLLVASASGSVTLTSPGGEIVLDPADPEPERFRGRSVGLSFRMHEPPEIARDWLRWHRDFHGMDSALIVDRAETDGFADALAGLLDADDPDVLVLRPGVPLGKPGLGPEADVYFAPDAPRRDRLTPPPEDRWQGPFGEIGLFDLIRHRYLGAARAVMQLDLSDLLAPTDGPSVFDRAGSAPGGVVPLAGRAAYPWKVPEGRSAGYGDHICRKFDSTGVRWRWCVAPARTGPDASWRLVRVAGAAARRSDVLVFWRCMALRHPGRKAAAIAPKSSLVEDDAQREALGARFGAPGERMPALGLREPVARGSITFVTTVKNEAPFIVDWLAWHRAMGAERFLIYSNDCTDGTEELLEALDAAGVIAHRNNDGYRATGRTPQHSVLAAADDDPLVRDADWTLFADVDEYVNVKVGNGRFDDLFAAMPGANMISMTWRLFGNADIDAFEDAPVFEQFGLCAPELCRKPHQAWGFKTLFRNQGIFRKLGVHRPKGLNPQLAGEIRWVNGSGRPMPVTMFRNGWRSTSGTYGYDIVQLNHYAVRSTESFLVKRERGRANHVTRDQGLLYWFRMNHNAETGGVNPAMKPHFAAERARLMALPGVAEAHAEGVRRHRARIAELRDDPVYSEFFDTLRSPRMRALSRLLARFGAGVFHAGPDAVPDAKVFGAWSDGEVFTVPLPESVE